MIRRAGANALVRVVAAVAVVAVLALLIGVWIGDKSSGANAQTGTSTPDTSKAPGQTQVPPSQVTQVVPPAQNNNGGGTAVCLLDKIGTWSEVNSAGPQRIEVGGGDIQHADLYPQKGIKSVSYIVPAMKPIIYMGFGSIWQGNPHNCGNFDWVADATSYAQGRLGNGHSGLVVDLRSNPPKLINAGGLSNDQIAQILGQQAGALSGVTLDVNGLISGMSGTSSSSTQNQNGSCTAAKTTYATQVSFTAQGPAIVNAWSDSALGAGKEVKVLIPAGTSASFLNTGGELYNYPSTCSASQVQSEFDKDGFTAMTIDQAKSAGLIAK